MFSFPLLYLKFKILVLIIFVYRIFRHARMSVIEFKMAVEDFAEENGMLEAAGFSTVPDQLHTEQPASKNAQPDVQLDDDDLCGRKQFVLSRSTTKSTAAPRVNFKLNDSIYLSSRRYLRNGQDESGGAFNIVNFRRLTKDSSTKAGSTKNKPFDFGLYEYLSVDLLEALVYFIGSKKVEPLTELPLDELKITNPCGVVDTNTNEFDSHYDMTKFFKIR